MLPFAIALDLETEWSDQFVDILSEQNLSADNADYRLRVWYRGNDHFSNNHFLSALAAGLATSIVAASTPPSTSSSGSSSGGFSSGGGGGW